jgi:hypothetical protein
VGDIAIVNSTVAAAPKDYTLSGTQELLLKAVSAVIDGSLSATDYVPMLQLLAPDGTVMWSSPTDQTVTVGSSANVSWFPG